MYMCRVKSARDNSYQVTMTSHTRLERPGVMCGWVERDSTLMRGAYYYCSCDLIVIVSILITDILKAPSVTWWIVPKLAALTGW